MLAHKLRVIFQYGSHHFGAGCRLAGVKPAPRGQKGGLNPLPSLVHAPRPTHLTREKQGTIP